MTGGERSLPRPGFDPVDHATWAAKAAPDGDLSRLRATLPLGVDVEPLYAAAPSIPAGRAGSRPWTVAHEYGLLEGGDGSQLAAAIAEDVPFGLASAWVRLEDDACCGVGDGSTAPSVDALRLVRRALGDRPLWVDAGVVRPALVEAWSRVGGPGGVLADPLGALARAGGWGVSPDEARRRVSEAVRRHRAGADKTLLLSALPYQDAGLDVAQGLGAVLATLLELCRGAQRDGLSAGAVMSASVVRLALDGDVFTGIAGMRAARWLWRALAHRLGADAAMHLSARTSACNRTRHDPWVNLLRGTAETFAGAVGGADEIVTEAFTRPLGVPRGDARRHALATSTILRDEAHLGRVDDAGAGSGYVEALTRIVAQRAWSFAQEIERAGGMVEALIDGMVSDRCRQAAEERVGRLRAGIDVLTGLTIYPDLGEPSVSVDPGDPPSRPSRPSGTAYVVTVPRIEPRRFGEDYDALRDLSDAHLRANGERTACHVVAVGRSDARGRVDRAVAMARVAGMVPVVAQDGELPEQLRAAIVVPVEAEAPTIEALVAKLRARGARAVAVAERPPSGDIEDVVTLSCGGVASPAALHAFALAAGGDT